MTLFIGLLNPGATGSEVMDFLVANGATAIRVAVQSDHHTGRSRRFALIEADDAASVVAACDGKLLNGQPMTVKTI